ncbi:MAG: ABC transporter ATP-binding protein [bacterium]
MTPAPPPVIDLRRLGREFPTIPPVTALAAVDLRVERGEYSSIVGPSGSGKSTLLNIIGCLDRHTSGEYWFEGLDVSSLSDRQRAGLRGQRIGFVFQSFHLMPHRDIVENVMQAELYNRSPAAGRRERAETALRRVGLGHRLGFLPGRLSGGERQRVAIARAIVHSPSLLLCDEPTGNLDSRNSASVMELFDELNRDGLTVLVITHDDQVSAHARRSVRIIDGTLTEVAHSTRKEASDAFAS